jgi:acyl carrier protein
MTVHNSEDTKKKLRAFVLEAFLFGDDSEPFSDSDSFMSEGIMDSTGVLELVAFLETEFGIKVQDEEMIPKNLDSLDNLATYIAGKQA